MERSTEVVLNTFGVNQAAAAESAATVRLRGSRVRLCCQPWQKCGGARACIRSCRSRCRRAGARTVSYTLHSLTHVRSRKTSQAKPRGRTSVHISSSMIMRRFIYSYSRPHISVCPSRPYHLCICVHARDDGSNHRTLASAYSAALPFLLASSFGVCLRADPARCCPVSLATV